MAVVFISHSSRDNEKVQEIVNHIENAGFDSVFLDHDEEKGIKTGEHWEQRLYSEIKRTHAMLLILSPAWIDSKWCFAEYTQAKALGKEIIPIIINQGVDNEVDKWIVSYLQKSDMTKDDDILNRVINRIKEISIKTQAGFKWDKYRAPYPGMMSFEEEDAAIFFGREDETREIIEKLNAMKNRNAPKFLNIVAASGMGKSSFLKAGILPQLKRSYSDRWIVLPTFRPTKRPLYAFSKLLASVLKKEQEYKSIYKSLQQENYREILDDITTEIEFISPGSTILLALDQAEELYSLADKKEKEQFFICLSYLLKEKEHFFTIWTLRADFLKEFQSDKTLKSIYKNMELFALSPLRKENVAYIIKKPAVVAGLDIDERLIEKIKEDIQTTDALPLLALGLSELYQKHGKDGRLTLEEYKSLAPNDENPLEHIVKQKAEEAIKAFKEDNDAMKALKEAFIPRLVGVNRKNEYIKRVALWKELPTQAQAILENLVKARLLIKKTTDDNKEVIEIAHEALIRKWPLLQTWLTDEHEFLVGKSQLEIALQEYKKEKSNNKHKAYLTGLRLQKAFAWLGEYPTQLSDDEKNYIKESVAFDRKQARKRKSIYTSAFLLVLLFGIFSAWQWRVAKVNESRIKTLYAQSEEQKILLKTLQDDISSQKKENNLMENSKMKAKKNNQALMQSNEYLSGLSKLSLLLLSSNNEDIVKKYVNYLLKSNAKEEFISLLKLLILDANSMDKNEKQYWYQLLSTITNKQAEKLVKTLITNHYKLSVFELKYQDRIEKINKILQRKKKVYTMDETIPPVSNGIVTKSFGMYEDPVYKIKIFNESITIKTIEKNAKVRSVLYGKVVFSAKSEMLGNVVVLAHKNKLHTVYAGLDKISPNIIVGKVLKKGMILGRVKNEFIFQVTQDSKYINPLDLVAL